MKTSKKQTLPNGEAESTFFPADFLASLSVLPASEKAMKMTATSGRKCTAALKKSSLLGSCVRMLLESSQWSNKARFLKWQVKQLCSEKLTLFCDSDIEQPLPSNASAQTLRQTDMKSSRCLFQLVPLAHPTSETESSSSEDELLKTSTTWDCKEMKSWDKGRDRGTLGQQAKMGKLDHLLPTPLTKGLKVSDKNGKTRFIDLDLLPTPTAAEGEKWTNTWNPNSQMGQSLSAMAGSGMLPTPRTSGHEKYDTLAKRKGHKVAMSCLDSVVDYVTQKCADKDGETFRLSPLFTEEMMGFPLMWTTFPYLRTNGETSQSKPTATPSSPK